MPLHTDHTYIPPDILEVGGLPACGTRAACRTSNRVDAEASPTHHGSGVSIIKPYARLVASFLFVVATQTRSAGSNNIRNGCSIQEVWAGNIADIDLLPVGTIKVSVGAEQSRSGGRRRMCFQIYISSQLVNGDGAHGLSHRRSLRIVGNEGHVPSWSRPRHPRWVSCETHIYICSRPPK